MADGSRSRMTWSLKTSVPYSSSTRLILRSLSQRSSIHSTQGKERMFRVYFDLAKCFETIDGNRGGGAMGASLTGTSIMKAWIRVLTCF